MSAPITVLYFAAIRDVLNRTEETVALNNAATVAELASWLEARYPELRGRMSSVRFAINETFATPDARLAHGDVVAVIPPVAGG